MVRCVEKVSVPQGSLVARVPFHDYADAYRMRVDGDRVPDVDTIARAFASGAPSWVMMLMRVRDAIVSLFGLKRSSDAPPSVENDEPIVPGAWLGMFRVVERNEREIVAGEDDSHLDFRLSLLVDRDEEGPFVVMSTVVKFHNALGRAYFVPVGPMHRLIVPAMVRKAVDLSKRPADRPAASSRSATRDTSSRPHGATRP